MEIKFTVTLEEANLILSALGKLPIEQGLSVFNKIQAQGQAQVNVSESKEEVSDIKPSKKNTPSN